MSTDSANSAASVQGILTLMGKSIHSDAYWIVKLAFHPEMAKYFKAHGGKHGSA